MESISSFVHQDEFLAVFLKPLQWFSFWRSSQKAERQVKTRSEDDFEWKLSNGESNAMSGVARSWAKEWRNLFTKFGISGQSGVCRWKKTSRKSNQATGAPRLKFRNRTSTSESTREFSSSKQASKQLVLDNQNQAESDDKNILTPRAQGNLHLHHQNGKTWNTRTMITWARYFSVCIRNWECLQPTQHSQRTHTSQMYWYGECLSLRRWKPPFILGRISNPNRTSNRTQNSTSEIGISQWSSEQMG